MTNFTMNPVRDGDPSFKLGARRSALGNLPEDEARFPVATWLKHTLSNRICKFDLNGERIRRSSPPGQPSTLLPDGANLPWVVAALKENEPSKHAAWLALLRTVLPGLSAVHTVVRPEDQHCYLVVKHHNDLETPSWMLSDGTLRLLALTLLAYVSDDDGVCLLEVPENGLHSDAVEAVFKAFSDVAQNEDRARAQILTTTHSPVVFDLADPEQLLCFVTTETGATEIVSGADRGMS